MAGLRTYTVQESENIDLGQCGAIMTDQTSTDGSNAVTPPSGHVFIAIQTFNTCAFYSLQSEDNSIWVNTSQGANGNGATGGDTIATTDAVNSGGIIYGRWTSVEFNAINGNGYAILYIGK